MHEDRGKFGVSGGETSLPVFNTDTESSADESAALSPLQKIAREMDSLDALESEIREYSSHSLSVILGIVSYIHIAWARGYVEYENTIFAPSGFTEDGSHATLYEGGSTPEIDARWSELIDGTKQTTFLFLGKKIF